LLKVEKGFERLHYLDEGSWSYISWEFKLERTPLSSAGERHILEKGRFLFILLEVRKNLQGFCKALIEKLPAS